MNLNGLLNRYMFLLAFCILFLILFPMNYELFPMSFKESAVLTVQAWYILFVVQVDAILFCSIIAWLHFVVMTTMHLSLQIYCDHSITMLF